jgi:hypothetical protein
MFSPVLRSYFDDNRCFQRWTQSFGRLNSPGYATAAGSHKFAVCVGECGSFFYDHDTYVRLLPLCSISHCTMGHVHVKA